jgi:hypothetical protein
VKNLVLATLLPILLVSCQSINTESLLVPRTPSENSQVAVPADSCNDAVDLHGLNPKGGKQLFPGILQDNGNFAGVIRYASYPPLIRPQAVGFSCDFNRFNVPVPTGYSADWFGYWGNFSDSDDIVFGVASLHGFVYSTTWSAGVKYYMEVRFKSPFEDGFVIPANSSISLEIVHPSK